MADGFARLTNKPQAVIVHVDVGTQALGPAVHNASCGRVPVLIFAGLSPYTLEGELHGSRTEFIHWLQDVPDQKAIVSQYCRYTAEIKTGKNIKQLVNRALQFATSDPKGPVYLTGAREVMEEEIEPYQIVQEHWSPVITGNLPQSAVEEIVTALIEADSPMIITGFTGRRQESVAKLMKLADTIPGLRVYDAGTTEMSFPFNHRASVNPAWGAGMWLQSADVIVVLDCDVPWIPTQRKPRADARIYHIDVDPLKAQISLFYIAATARYRGNSGAALVQLMDFITSNQEMMMELAEPIYVQRWTALGAIHAANLEGSAAKAVLPAEGFNSPINMAYLSARIRDNLPKDTIYATEAVTNHVRMMEQLQPSIPGTSFTKGAGGLGWSCGAALGIKLAKPEAFVCSITGDGSFIFSHPTAVYWISAHYGLPTLTIVLNNGGWVAPRVSAKIVNPDGLAQKVTAEELGIGFGELPPDYGAVAEAAGRGRIWKARIEKAGEVVDTLKQAVEVVKDGRGAVIDVLLA
ncbi:MAG: hypothetical protein L6R37_007584 [Teloschistes peruensis]|nr:MAG: hypothetical protein L6R37_007584 [Teloschistes peruensis]